MKNDERQATRNARRDYALIGVFAGTILITAAYASAWLPTGTPVWGVCCMVVGCATLIGSATLLGALRSGVRRRVALFAAVFLFVVITAGFGVPLWLPAETPDTPLILGLPLRTAIEIYGVGLLPLAVLPVLFAIEFKRGDR